MPAAESNSVVGSVLRDNAALWRAGAYLLVFISGAAAMFALRGVRESSAPIVQSPIIHVPVAVDAPVRAPVEKVSFESSAEQRSAYVPSPVAASTPSKLQVPGLLEPAPGRFAKLPLATFQAVAFVDVQPGDSVKKGWQVFSHWESPDRLQAAKTELAKTRKLLEVAKLQAAAAEKTAARLRRLAGSIAAQEMQDAETAADIRRQEFEGLQLAVSESESRFAAMEFEFKQAFVTSPIDGIVAAVDVAVGERRQAGGPFRGVTILDPSVLHCRCLLDQEQVRRLQQLAAPGCSPSSTQVAVDQDRTAEPENEDAAAGVHAIIESEGRQWPATVTCIGLLTDASSGLTPVILEVPNPDVVLRSGTRVNVVLATSSEQP
ncbi:MAG: efflux RND transporter periplasmic adaptor subunit [Pirellulaceae bacterium]